MKNGARHCAATVTATCWRDNIPGRITRKNIMRRSVSLLLLALLLQACGLKGPLYLPQQKPAAKPPAAEPAPDPPADDRKNPGQQ